MYRSSVQSKQPGIDRCAFAERVAFESCFRGRQKGLLHGRRRRVSSSLKVFAGPRKKRPMYFHAGVARWTRDEKDVSGVPRNAFAFDLASQSSYFPIAEQGARANGLIGPSSGRSGFLKRRGCRRKDRSSLQAVAHL